MTTAASEHAGPAPAPWRPARRGRATGAAAAATAASTSRPVPSRETSSASQADPSPASTAADPVAVSDAVSSTRPSRRTSWCSEGGEQGQRQHRRDVLRAAGCRRRRGRRRRRRWRSRRPPAGHPTAPGHPQGREPAGDEQPLCEQHGQHQHRRRGEPAEHQGSGQPEGGQGSGHRLPPANGGSTSTVAPSVRAVSRPVRTPSTRKLATDEHPGQRLRRAQPLPGRGRRRACRRRTAPRWCRRRRGRRPSSGRSLRPPVHLPCAADAVSGVFLGRKAFSGCGRIPDTRAPSW